MIAGSKSRSKLVEEEEEEGQAASSYLTDSAFTNPRSMDQMLVREVESNQTVALS